MNRNQYLDEYLKENSYNMTEEWYENNDFQR
jgi:rsbT co-antagonist protein RsbR